MASKVETRSRAVSADDRAPRIPGSSRILAIIDDGGPDNPVVEALVGGLADQITAGVVLLNLQPEPDDVRTRGLFKAKTRAILMERGHNTLAAAERVLTQAGLPHTCHVAICNDPAEILRLAHRESCGLIVVSAPVQPSICWPRRWLPAGLTSRSIACALADQADLPVLVLRRRGH